MLVVISPVRVVNLEQSNQIYIEMTNRDSAYLKFGSYVGAKFPTLDAAKKALAEMVMAYERGDKVYRIEGQT